MSTFVTALPSYLLDTNLYDLSLTYIYIFFNSLNTIYSSVCRS